MSRAMLICLAALSAFGACTDEPATPNGGTPPRPGLFSPEVERVQIEVDYQRGAAPFTGSSGLGPLAHDAWDLFDTNIRRIFATASPRVIDFPTTLDAMEELTELETPPDGGFGVSELLAIAARHQDARSTARARVFYILFLDGYFRDRDGNVSTHVIGVSIGDTGVIAMFKPVITGTSSPRFVEQATLVHELGHAVGLVNNGLPVTGDHHDHARGAHCNNRDCVMYYLHEGASELVGFIGRIITTQETVLFGPECLGDIDSAASSP